jgi:hypothetical protein
MTLRILAILIATLTFVVIAARLLKPSVVPASSDVARPCLLSSDRCVDLSAVPFAPCSVSDRCRRDPITEALGSPVTGRAIPVPREFRRSR